MLKRFIKGQKPAKLFKLLLISLFFLAYLQFAFSLPPVPAVQSNSTASMSMNYHGYYLRSSSQKHDFTFPFLLLLAAIPLYIVLFHSLRYIFSIFHLFYKSIPVSPGIRAPPF